MTDLDDIEDDLEYARRAMANLRTHSWLYGMFDVTCTMCGVSKGDHRSFEECSGFSSHGCF